MAESNQILYTVRVNTADGKVQIDGLTRGFVKADTAVKNLNKSISDNTNKLRSNIDKTGLAGATLVELGRTISDSNYGMRAMANNISQLSTLFITLVSTTKGLRNGLQALWKAFSGPLGLIVVFQAVIAIMERFSLENNKAKKNLSEFTSIIKEHVGSLDELILKIDEYKLSKELLEETESIAKEKSALQDQLENLSEAVKKQDPVALRDALNSWKPHFWNVIDSWFGGGMEAFSEGTQLGAQLELMTAKIEERLKELDEKYEEIRKKRAAEIAARIEAERQKKLTKMLEDWNEKRIKIAASGDIELLSIEKSYAIAELEALGATKEQLLDVEIYYQNKLNKILLEGQKGIKKGIVDATQERKTQRQKEAEDELQVMADHNNEQLKLLNERIQKEKEIQERREQAVKDRLEREREERKAVLESISSTISSTTGFLNSEYQRQIDIEKNKTNAINNQLKERLRNENLSVKERKSIQNQIAQNDEALRLKQEQIEKKRFKLNKAANMATAAINTYLAATDVLAKEKLGAVGKIAAMVAVIGAGLAQVAAISRQQFQSSSATTTGGVVNVDTGLSQGGQAPDFNIVGQSAQSQLAQTVAGQLGKPTKAYIVSKDVTTAQELDRNRINGASLG